MTPVQLWARHQSAIAISSIVNITSRIVAKESAAFKHNLRCLQLSKFPAGVVKIGAMRKMTQMTTLVRTSA